MTKLRNDKAISLFFKKLGIPDICVLDNGRSFSSKSISKNTLDRKEAAE